MNTATAPTAFSILSYGRKQEDCEAALLRALRVRPLYAPLRSCIPLPVQGERS